MRMRTSSRRTFTPVTCVSTLSISSCLSGYDVPSNNCSVSFVIWPISWNVKVVNTAARFCGSVTSGGKKPHHTFDRPVLSSSSVVRIYCFSARTSQKLLCHVTRQNWRKIWERTSEARTRRLESMIPLAVFLVSPCACAADSWAHCLYNSVWCSGVRYSMVDERDAGEAEF
jgi:hypothetical protein